MSWRNMPSSWRNLLAGRKCRRTRAEPSPHPEELAQQASRRARPEAAGRGLMVRDGACAPPHHEGREGRRKIRLSLPPAAVQPEPLLGVFADPALDHVSDRLHRALDV